MSAFCDKFYFQSLYFLPYKKGHLEVAIGHQHFDFHLFMQGEVWTGCHCKKSAKELLVPISKVPQIHIDFTVERWIHG